MIKRLFVVILGIAIVVLGVYLINKSNNLVKVCTEQTTGKVIEIIEKEDYDSDSGFNYLYYPVIEFSDGETTISYESNEGSNPSHYSVNDEVEVHYNPNNLEEHYVKGETGMNKGIGIFCIVLGIIFSLGGIFGKM